MVKNVTRNKVGITINVGVSAKIQRNMYARRRLGVMKL